MATIFFFCLQCGEYLKASHQVVSSEISAHMCQKEFDVVQFKNGIALLQDKLKSLPLLPPPPPPMPSVPLYMENKKTYAISRRDKGYSSMNLLGFPCQIMCLFRLYSEPNKFKSCLFRSSSLFPENEFRQHPSPTPWVKKQLAGSVQTLNVNVFEELKLVL